MEPKIEYDFKDVMHNSNTIDVHHDNTDLKVFVVVIPKGLVGGGPAIPSLGMTPTTKYNL